MYLLTNNSLISFKTILLSLAFVATVCSCSNDPKTFKPKTIDEITSFNNDSYDQANKVLQADILVVMDYSFSMNYAQHELLKSFDQLLLSLKDSSIDYNIAFVNGHKQSTLTEDSIANHFNENMIINTKTNSSQVSSFIQNQLDLVGNPNNSNDNYFLYSLDKILRNQRSQFLRSAAQLVVVMASDEDDTHSNISVEQLAQKIKSYKNHPDYVSSRAFLAGVENSLGHQCPLNYSWQKEGHKLSELSNLLDHQQKGTYCLTDNSYNQSNNPHQSLWYNLGQDITKFTKRFQLRIPIDIQSLKVFIDNQLVTSGWQYKESTQEVIFDDNNIPAAGSSIRFEYQALFFLSSIPEQNSIEVLINGNSIDKSAWQYLESPANRILFSPSHGPKQGDKVMIKYHKSN